MLGPTYVGPTQQKYNGPKTYYRLWMEAKNEIRITYYMDTDENTQIYVKSVSLLLKG